MGMANKYPRLQIDVLRGAPKSLRARYLLKGLWSSEELIRLCLSQKCRQRNAAEGGPRRRTTSPPTTRHNRTPSWRMPKQQQPNKPLSSPPLRRIHRPLRQVRQSQEAPAPFLTQSRRISWSQPPNSALDRLARRAAHRGPQLSQRP